MSNPTLLQMPLAVNGDKNTIPVETTSNTGLFSQKYGFQSINSLPLSAGGKAISRHDYNGTMYLLSNILFYAQKGYVFEFDSTQDYFTGCEVIDPADDNKYRCIADVAADGDSPSEDTTHWERIFDESAFFYRMPNVTYTVGDVKYAANLPSWGFLTCITGGVAGSGELVIPAGAKAGDTITDGEVVWRLDSLANMKKALAEATGYGIISGCTPTISGLNVTVAAGVVHLADGTRKELVQTNITLDSADSSNPRIDLVYIDSTGTVAKITGTAAASPVVPTLPSGGISVARVRVAAGATTGTINRVQTIAPNLVSYGVVNVKDFGAVGDGVTDDTAALQAAIDHGGLVIMPEGIYRISEGLLVNVNKTTFRGVSSRAIITPLSTFPEDGTLITFCKTVNNDFLGRKYRTQTHGNFSLIGTMEDYPSSVPNITGMKVAGDVGSTYEGHTDCQQYENIVFGWMRDGLNYGSHNYKCIFRNLIFNNGVTRYSLFSDSQQTDSGESNMCECCSFWGGRLKLKTSMNFISCTIHIMKAPNDDEPYGHGFFNGMYSLTDCHIEALYGGDVETTIFKNAFYAQGATVNFTDCEFIGSVSKTYIDNAFFYAPWTTGSPTQINVTGAYAKWLFGRLRRKNDDTESTLCKGNVRIDKTSWGFDYSNAGTIGIPIWGETPFKTLDGYTKLGGLESATITTTDNADGSINVDVTNASSSQSYKMLAKKISVGTQTTVRLKMKIILHTVGVQTQVQFSANTKGNYGLRFFGGGEEKKFQGVSSYYTQVTAAADGDIYDPSGLTVPIPVGTEYILYGPAFNTNLSAFNFDVVECYAELL